MNKLINCKNLCKDPFYVTVSLLKKQTKKPYMIIMVELAHTLYNQSILIEGLKKQTRCC